MTGTRNSLLTAALHAAGRDWPIFPVHGIRNGACTCGSSNCDSPGKHPLTAHGFKNATTSLSTIRSWWKKYPRANIGTATGEQSGILVIDVDANRGGLASLHQFERANGSLPPCPTVKTGGGGLHLYFQLPSGHVKSRVDVLPGIDVRGVGGYIVAPGSNHKSGRRYLWAYGRTPKKFALPPLPEE